MGSCSVEVFTKENPQFHEDRLGSLAAKTLEHGYQSFVSNVNTKEIAVSFGTVTLLGTVNEKEYDNSPICSPFNLFCLYPIKKIENIKVPWLKYLLTVSTSLLSYTFRFTQFDRVIQLNNKPCDAIIYPQLSSEDVNECVKQLLQLFPKHAIIFPRIDKVSSPLLFKNLEAQGFLMIPTRPIHLFLPDEPYNKRSHTKRDFSLFKKEKFTLVPHEEISPEDIFRISTLYNLLFVDKHGKDSPQLTFEFFRQALMNKWYTFFALRNPEGVLDAFLSYETHENLMACGPLGYDTSKDKEDGLYRMLFAHSLKIAEENQKIFNFGGGNELFKMNRGSRREIGYTAVYCENLPIQRRWPWMLLHSLSNKFTSKIFEKVTF